MKRSEELLQGFDEPTRLRVIELATDMAEFYKMDIEKVYEAKIFPWIYSAMTVEAFRGAIVKEANKTGG